MKRTIFILLMCFVLHVINAECFGGTMDTTRVAWDGTTNRLCLEDLVWCGLSDVTPDDSATFDTFVSGRNATIFDWRGYGVSASGEYVLVLCIVQIADTSDLATEAAIFRTSSLTDDASPLFLGAELQWPDDGEATIAAGIRQWHIADINTYSGSINWLPVVNGLNQRGHADVVIGIIDSGISLYWNEANEYDEDDLSHGDLMNHGESSRFTLGEVFDVNEGGDGLFDENRHGTMVASIIGAFDHADMNGADGAAHNFGMIGINTVSELYINSINQRVDENLILEIDIVHAILHCWFDKGCNIINLSCGGQFPDGLYEWLFRGMEFVHDVTGDNHNEPPLCVISCGNGNQSDEVTYPAGFAFWGDPNRFDPHPRGYRYVMSVGGIRSDGSFWGSSFNAGKHRVSCMAPADNLRFAVLRDAPEDDWYSFAFADGTSIAAPIVAGIASLVISQAIDNGIEIETYDVRRIIEKTSKDTNFGDEIVVLGGTEDGSLFDIKYGYGQVDCEAAVTNLDILKWEVEPETWYWVSSRIDPVYADPRRVMEDLTFQDDDFDNRLDELWTWDPGDDDLIYNPAEDLWGEDPWGEEPDWEWDFTKGYSFGLIEGAEDIEQFFICGVEQDIDVAIALEEDWNFVAYFPDWEDEAEDVLTSIATWGDGNSDLILAKGYNGDFYSPGYSFSNLTMKPGEGYQMNIDATTILTYPTTQPSSISSENHREPTEPIHFQHITCTGDFMPILINSLSVENREIEVGDEIGVFVNDTMCVGGCVVGELPMGFAAWRDNLRTNRIEGFSNFRDLTFRYWDNSEEEEIGHDDISIASTDAADEPSLWVKDLNFTGNILETTVPSDFGLISVYPNPFNSQTTVRYSLAEAIEVRINVLDINGRQIRTLVNGFGNSGQYRVSFEASSLASGSYVIEMIVSESRFTKRVELVK